MTSRDKLRAASVGAKKNFRNQIVEWGDVEFEVRQPTVGAKSEIMRKARVPMTDNPEEAIGKIDYAAMQAWSVIFCTFVPGTDERLFDDTDFNSIIDSPSGGYVEKLGRAAMELLNEAPIEDAKNSEEAIVTEEE